MRDGHGPSANDQGILAKKKRQGSARKRSLAHAPEQMSVENQESALIASCPRPVSMGRTASATLRTRPSRAEAPRAPHWERSDKDARLRVVHP